MWYNTEETALATAEEEKEMEAINNEEPASRLLPQPEGSRTLWTLINIGDKDGTANRLYCTLYCIRTHLADPAE